MPVLFLLLLFAQRLAPALAGDNTCAGFSIAEDPLSALPDVPQNMLIRAISVEGNCFVSTESILHAMKTSLGGLTDREVLRKDLKAINSIGCFDDRCMRGDSATL